MFYIFFIAYAYINILNVVCMPSDILQPHNRNNNIYINLLFFLITQYRKYLISTLFTYDAECEKIEL